MEEQAAARRLLEHELGTMYGAEHRLAETLSKMIGDAGEPKLVSALETHKAVTQRQIERLGGVFDMLRAKPSRGISEGYEGLMDQLSNFLNAREKISSAELDLCIASTVMRVQYYEIASYKYLIPLSNQANLNRAAIALYDSLTEERDASNAMERMLVEALLPKLMT
ncbi:MAG: ferritin-like domain-containing protein [Actinomycetota bacterium]